MRGFADPNERVAQGQAGTGQAFILPNVIHDPLAAGMERARLDKAAADKLAADKAKAEAARKEAEKAAFLNPEYSLNRDVSLIRDKVNSLNKVLADGLARHEAGLGGDPLDPSTKEGRQFQELKTSYLGEVAISKNDKEWLTAITADADANPAKYKQGYKEAIADYLSRDPSERAKMGRPNLDAYFDEAAYDNQIWDGIKQTDAVAGHSFADDGRTIVTNETTFYDPNIMMTGAADALKDPMKMTAVTERWNALPEEEKDKYYAELKNVNTARGLKGMKLLQPLEFFNYKNAVETRMRKQTKQNVQQVSEGNYGIGEKQAAAEELLQKIRGAATGNYTGMEWTTEPTVFGPKGTGYNIGMKGLAITDAFSGFKYGDTGLNVGKFAYDPVSKKVRMELVPGESEVTTTTDEKGNVKTTRKEISPAAKQLAQEISGREFDVNELVTELAVPIIAADGKTYSMGAMMKKLQEQNALPVDAIAPLYEKFPGGEKQSGPPGTKTTTPSTGGAY